MSHRGFYKRSRQSSELSSPTPSYSRQPSYSMLTISPSKIMDQEAEPKDGQVTYSAPMDGQPSANTLPLQNVYKKPSWLTPDASKSVSHSTTVIPDIVTPHIHSRSCSVVVPKMDKRDFCKKSVTQEDLKRQLSLMTGQIFEKQGEDRIFLDPTPEILRMKSDERLSIFKAGMGQDKLGQKSKNFFWDWLKQQTHQSAHDKTLLQMRQGTAVEQAFALTACSDRFLTIEERLAKMRVIFEAAKLDGYNGLNMEQFKRVAGRNVETGAEMTDEDARILFMKIDANTDGLIQWEEFVTFSLLEYRERARMIEQARIKPFPHGMIEIKSSHYDQIIRVLFVPRWSKNATTIDHESGQYALLGVDGWLSLWTLDMKCQQTQDMQEYSQRTVPCLYMDMAYLYIANTLCVASTDRDISFIELHRDEIRRRYHLINLNAVVTTMTSWSDLKTRKELILLWGDLDGDIWVIVFNTKDYNNLFYQPNQPRSISEYDIYIKFIDVQHKMFAPVSLYHLPRVHKSWVQCIVYVGDQEGFFSCAHSGTKSLYFGDINGRRHRDYFEVQRGILCLEYSPKLNIIATGGIDHILRLWNPYHLKKAIAMLEGFTVPVMKVGFHNRKNLVIGIDLSNTIMVFDMFDYNCLQSIHGNSLKLGKFSISACYFNQVLEHILICTSTVAMLHSCDMETRKMEAPAHHKTVVAALYNKTFGLMVSGCQLSAIHIWDMKTGEKLIDFQNAHSVMKDCKEVPVQITCMAFDDQERRLLTGARDGSVKLWNLHVGLLLGELDVIDKQLVTSIVCTSAWIFVAGWGRRVIEYPDLFNLCKTRIWPRHHQEDILSMVMIGKIYVVTGSYDGDIVICSRELRTAVARMNAFQGIGVYSAFPHPKAPDMVPPSPNPPKSPRPGQNINQSADDDDDEDKEPGYCNVHVDMTRLGLPSDFKFSPSTYSPDLTTKLRKSLFVPSTGYWAPEKRGKRITRARNSLIDVFYPPQDWQPRRSSGDALQTTKTVEEYDYLAQKFEAAVEILLVLETRLQHMYNPYTAILLAGGAEGWCRAWSMGGGLLGQFSVVTVNGECITGMVVTEDDEYLITADSLGYIKMWDIKEYCRPSVMTRRESDARRDYQMYMFPYLHTTTAPGLEQVVKMTSSTFKRPPPLRSRPSKTLFSPHMVNQYQAHLEPINWVEYVPGRRLIITAAKCTIRVWTFSGRYVNSFGNHWEHLPGCPNPVEPSELPRDVRRCGSPLTKQIVKGDVLEYWIHVATRFREKLEEDESPFMEGDPYPNEPELDESIRKFWLPELEARKARMSATDLEVPEEEKKKESTEVAVEEKPKTPEATSPSAMSVASDHLKTDQQDLGEIEKAKWERSAKNLAAKLEEVRWRFRMKTVQQLKAEIDSFKEGSDILGKSYKRFRFHRPLPKLSPLTTAGLAVNVYHTLDLPELSAISKKPEPPLLVSELTRINDILAPYRLIKKKVTRAELRRLRALHMRRLARESQAYSSKLD